MKKIVEKIKQDISKYDKVLYEQIISSSISEEEILNNSNKIYRHLNDFNNPDLNFKYLIKIVENKIVQEEIVSPSYTKIQENNLVDVNFKVNFGANDLKSDLSLTYIKSEYQKAFKNINDQQDLNPEKSKISKTSISKIISFIDLISQIDENKNNKNLILKTGNNSFPNALTKIIYGLLNDYAKKNKTVGFISLSLYYAEIKLSFGGEKYFDNKTFYLSKSVDVLYLDDLNPALLKEWFLVSYFFPIMKFRELNNKATFISISAAQFKEFEIEVKKLKISLFLKQEILNLLKFYKKIEY